MGGLPKSLRVFLSFSWRDDARSGFTQNSKPFIIEAGAGELDHNLGWRSFFRLVSNDRASVESEVTFLKVNFKCPEEAIRVALAEARVRLRPERVNHVWSYDFVHAWTHDGRSVRLFNLIDEHTRESLLVRAERR